MSNKETNVVYMADFLMQRRNKLVEAANAIYEKATKLSKHDDPRQDPFAKVLMKKIDVMAEQVDNIESHMRFIVRGGNAVQVKLDTTGYSLNLASLPHVNINLNPPPIE